MLFTESDHPTVPLLFQSYVAEHWQEDFKNYHNTLK